MDIFQAAIIYLACGTPFGAQYLLGQPSGSRRYFRATAVVLFWIAYLPPLLHRFVTRKLNESRTVSVERQVPGVPAEVRECSRAIESLAARSGYGIYEVRNAVERFAGISALNDGLDASDTTCFSALSEIDGHPDPDLSGAIIARRNRSDIERHRRQATLALLQLHAQLSAANGCVQETDSAFTRLFELCGNSLAAEQIKKETERGSKNTEHAHRPRALRPIWRTVRPEGPKKDLSLTLNEIAMTSSLQNED